jgi:hypothetical protein
MRWGREKEKSRRRLGFLLGFDLIEPTRRQNPDSGPLRLVSNLFLKKRVYQRGDFYLAFTSHYVAIQ